MRFESEEIIEYRRGDAHRRINSIFPEKNRKKRINIRSESTDVLFISVYFGPTTTEGEDARVSRLSRGASLADSILLLDPFREISRAGREKVRKRGREE